MLCHHPPVRPLCGQDLTLAAAFVWLQRQTQALSLTLGRCKATGLDMFYDTLSFGGTQQRLVIDGGFQLLPSQRLSSWSVLVSLMRVGWVTSDGVRASTASESLIQARLGCSRREGQVQAPMVSRQIKVNVRPKLDCNCTER